MNEWIVSQEFHMAGKWVVHRLGPNRPNKVARFDTREEAERCAAKITQAIEEIFAERIGAALA